MSNPDENTIDKKDAQPVGTTTGAVSGAATGAAVGSAGGPVGAVVGGAIGAVTGAVTGKGVEKAAQHATDPASHDAYWEENHARQPYGSQGSYESYRTAYRTGHEGVRKYGSELQGEELSSKLSQDYAGTREAGSVEWEHGRAAAVAAYQRGAEEMRIILREEQLRVGKREVETGQVHVRKVVHTEQVSVPVELRREDVVIERLPASEVRAGEASGAFEEQTIEVPLHAEEAVVEKTSQITGAVRVAKTAQVENQVVSDSVSKEDVEVVRDQATELRREDLGEEPRR